MHRIRPVHNLKKSIFIAVGHFISCIVFHSTAYKMSDGGYVNDIFLTNNKVGEVKK